MSHRRLVLAVPFLWLTAFFLVPFLIVVAISLAEVRVGIPPYRLAFSAANFASLVEDGFYLEAYLQSLRLAGISTLLCLLAGYPIALAIARAKPERRATLLMLVVLPFWTSFLIRVYAWMGILKEEGLLNALLLQLEVIDQPLVILNTNWAVLIGIVYSYLPFMILPLVAALERQDLSLLEAAADLGARPWRAFRSVTLPLSLPGIIAGCLLVFIPAVGEYVIPDLLGGGDTNLLGNTLWEVFAKERNWPAAAALAVALLAALVVPIALFQRLARRWEAA